MKLNVKEIGRDNELGVLKKEISMPNISSFETPSKSTKFLKPDTYLESETKVNEIVRRIDDDLLNSLEEGASSKIASGIKSNYKRGKLNLVIFDLLFDKIPDKNKLGTLAQHLYASSDTTIFLPTVRTAIFKENNKISENKARLYLEMIGQIINRIKDVGNTKVFIGTIPLLAPKFSRPIVEFYLNQGITSFSIDAGTRDIILHEADFRSILSQINDSTSLNKTFIHACNLGYPHFEKEETRADDFLGIFAYIDILGGTFKSRFSRNRPPRLKEFSRAHYSYRILPPLSRSPNEIRNFNQSEQLKEANVVRRLVGEEKIESHIQKKSKVDQLTINKLKSIAGQIDVG